MTPSPDSSPASADTLRRQLILAQVQLMELEDARDDLQSRLAAASDLLGKTQVLGNRALQEHDRLAAALRDCRDFLAAQQATSDSLRAELATARERGTTLATRIATLETQIAEREGALARANALVASHERRIAQLEAERRAMKATWSWRCTAPLRSLGKMLHRGGPPA